MLATMLATMRVTLIATCLFTLFACGQKGPLYLPQEPISQPAAEEQAASATAPKATTKDQAAKP